MYQLKVVGVVLMLLKNAQLGMAWLSVCKW